MAPAVPFALVGVVQLTAVAAWVGLAGGALFPRLRRRATPLFVLGALALAVADSITALRFGDPTSDPVAWLRVAGLGLLGVGAIAGSAQSLVIPVPGAVAGVVVPLGAEPRPALIGGAVGVVAGIGALWRGLRPGADRVFGTLLAAALALTGVGAAFAGPARHSGDAPLAELSARGLAPPVLLRAPGPPARPRLLGKIAGASLPGVG